MPQQPAQFQFIAVPITPAAEAAARRRMRTMESSYGDIRAWDLRVDGAEDDPAQDGSFHASVAAAIGGGDRLHGDARAADPLAALRLAFNALEEELDAEHESARHRAAQWLMTVRRRMSHLRSEA